MVVLAIHASFCFGTLRRRRLEPFPNFYILYNTTKYHTADGDLTVAKFRETKQDSQNQVDQQCRIIGKKISFTVHLIL